MKKTLMVLVGIFMGQIAFAGASNYECRQVNGPNQTMICFPINHVCMDPHGIGNGVPIETDCWSGPSRGCNPSLNNYPECAGGITANTCKAVELESGEANVCFPMGHVCMDPHGIGNGVPIETDCWDGGSRGCNSSGDNWPACAGGFIN